MTNVEQIIPHTSKKYVSCRDSAGNLIIIHSKAFNEKVINEVAFILRSIRAEMRY